MVTVVSGDDGRENKQRDFYDSQEIIRVVL